MILLPFINCFLLYICLEEKQIFNGPYSWVKNNIFPYLPWYIIKILGGCILCTATWMGIVEIALWLLINPFNYYIIGIAFYNAIATTILYKLLQ